MHGTRLLSPEEITANLWSQVNALKDAILMPRQKVRNLNSAIKKGKVSDEEFVMLKRLVEKRDRDAAHATVAPVNIAQYRSPRSLTPEIPSDVCVHMEKNEAGMMDPEQDQLESPWAGTSLETPGQQCPPNGEIWKTERTVADNYLLVGVGSSQGGDTSPPTERVGTRAGTAKHRQIHQTPFSGRQAANPKTRIKAAKRTRNLTPEGKERSHRLGMRL